MRAPGRLAAALAARLRRPRSARLARSADPSPSGALASDTDRRADGPARPGLRAFAAPALALAALAAALLPAAPAQAQTTSVWSATLTVGQGSGSSTSLFGCASFISALPSCNTQLSLSEFAFDGGYYLNFDLYWDSGGKTLLFRAQDLAPGRTTNPTGSELKSAFSALTLDVGGTALAFRDSTATGGNRVYWSYDPSPDWTDGQTVSISLGDATAPTLSTATVNGSSLVLTYNETLDTNSVPATSAFAVSAGGSSVTVSSVSVSGSAVTLTLASAVTHGQTVSLNYTKPAMNPIQDGAGNDAAGLSGQAVVNNTPHPMPPVSVTGGSAVDEGGDAVFTLTANPAPGAELTVNVTVAQTGAFVATGDLGTKTVTMPTSGTATYTVATEDDTTEESDGSVTLTVTSGTGYAVGTPATASVAVRNDDDTTAPTLSTAAVNGTSLVLTYNEALDESSVPATGAFTVTVAGSAGTVSGVSVSGSAVTLTLGTAVKHGQTVTLGYTVPGTNPVRDPSGNDSAGLTNQAVTNSTPPPVVSVAVKGPSAVEEGLVVGFTLTAEPAPAEDLSVNVNITQSGDFILGTRFIGEKTFRVPAAGTADFFITTDDDTTNEADGAVTLTLVAGDGYTVSGEEGKSAASVTVRDNDTPRVTIMGGSAVEEGGDVEFTLSVSPTPATALTVPLTIAQTGDFVAAGNLGAKTVTVPTTGTATYTVATVDDTVEEADGSVSATVGAGTGYLVGTPATASVTVRDDGDDNTAPVVDKLEVNGTSLGLNYDEDLDEFSKPATTAFAVTAGGSSVTVNAVVVSGDEVTLELGAAVKYGQAVTLSYDPPATNPIRDPAGNDAAAFSNRAVANVSVIPQVEVTGGNAVDEGGDAVFTVTAQPTPLAALTVPLTVTQDGDWVAAANLGAKTVTVPVSGTATYTVATVDDTLGEADGSVTVTLTYAVDGAGYEVAFDSRMASVAVRDDDDAVAPTLTAAAVNGASLVLTYDEALDESSVPATTDFFAYVGSDEVMKTGVTVSGSTVTVTLGTAVKHGQAVLIAYTKPSTNPIQDLAGNDAAGFTARTVTNNTPAPVASVAVSDTIVNNAVDEGDVVTFKVTVTPTPAVDVTVNLTVAQTGSFVASDDIGSKSVVVPSTTGENTFSVQTENDTVEEDDGRVSLTVASGTGYRVSSSAATARVTVRNDDDFTAPALAGDPLVIGSILTLTYDEPLKGDAQPAPGSYTVTVDGSTVAVSTVEVSGRTVTLTLASAVTPGQTVTLAYSRPSSNRRIQDLALNPAADLTSRNVLTVRPVVTLAAVPGSVREGQSFTLKATLSHKLASEVVIPLEWASDLSKHTQPESITVAAGQMSGSVTVQTHWDADGYDKHTRVFLDVDKLPEFLKPGDRPWARFVIKDTGKESMRITLTATPDTVTEGQPVTLAATLSKPYHRNLTLSLQLYPGRAPEFGEDDPEVYDPHRDGSAWESPPDDGAARRQNIDDVPDIVIPAGQTRGTATLVTHVDRDDEDEQWLLQVWKGSFPGDRNITGNNSDRQAQVMVIEAGVSLAVTPNPVPEGEAATVTVTLAAPAGEAVTVPVRLARGTAEAGDLGTLAPVVIEAGETSGAAVLETRRDADRDDETFTVSLGELPGGLRAGAPTSVEVTVDDDAPPLPAVSIAAGPAVSEGEAAVFTLTVDPAPAATLEVKIAVAETGGSFLAEGHGGERTVAMAAGQGSRTVRVGTADDDVDGPDGRVTAKVEAGAGYTVAGASSAAVAVADNDATRVTVKARDPSATERNQSDRARIELTLSRALRAGERLAVPLVFSGGAAGTDFMLALEAAWTGVTLDGTTVTFTGPDAPDRVFVALTALDDEDAVDDTVTVSVPASSSGTPPVLAAAGMSGGAAGVRAGNGRIVLYDTWSPDSRIQRSTLPPDFVVYHDPQVTGPAAIRYGVAAGLLDAAGVVWMLRTVSGTAKVDGLANVQNSVLPRFFRGDPEARGWGPSQPKGNNGGLRWLRGVLDALPRPDPVVPVIAIAAGEAVTEGEAAAFTLTVDPAPVSNLTVAVTVADAPGSDFVAEGDEGGKSVLIGSGETTVAFAVATVDDAAEEPGGPVTATLGAGDGYTVGEAASASVTVADDDTVVPVIAIAAGEAVTEGAAAAFTLTAAPAPTSDLTVTLEVADAPGSDFVAADNEGEKTVVIAAGAETAAFEVATVDDRADEPGGPVSVTVTAAEGAGYTVGEAASAEVAVADDDEPAPPGVLVSNAAQRQVVHTHRVLAQRFTTGGNAGGYALAAVRLPTVGRSATMRLRADAGGAPGAELASAVSDRGTFAFEAVRLAAGTAYWLTVNEEAARGSVSMLRTVRGGASTGLAGWALAAGALEQGRDGTWSAYVYHGAPAAMAVTLEGTVLAAGAAGLSVADAEAREGTDAAMAFAVSLDAARTQEVRVDYATADGTATAGADYTAVSGTLTFAPGETVKTVQVAIIDDGHDDDGETFTLRLSNAVGAPIADAEATGTIRNTDAMPKAWIARFGRTVADQVLAAVETRMSAPPAARNEVTLGGQRIGLDASAAGGDGAEVREAAGMETAAKGLADWFGRAGDLDENRRQALRDRNRTMTEREFLLGSSFSLAAGDPREGHYALWGRGAVSRFDGREDGTTLDGEVASALFGADWTRERTALGLIVGHSMGEGGYGGASSGTVRSTLTGLYPWGRHALTERVSVWGAAGYGEGTLTLTPANDDGTSGAALRTDLDLAMGAAGLRGTVIEAPAEGGIELAVKTDAMAVRTTTAKVQGLSAADADVTRLRLGLEGTRAVGLGGGAVLTPTLELGVRHDGGDAETGFGVDVGGGLAWRDPGRGLSAELGGRGLLSHESDGFREVGLSAALAFDPRPASDRGPSLTLKQTMGGAASGGADALLGSPTLAGLAANDDDGELLASRRFEAVFGYGFAALGGGFTATPEVGVGLSNTGREVRLGWRLTPGTGSAFELSLEAARRESETKAPEHRMGLTFQARW